MAVAVWIRCMYLLPLNFCNWCHATVLKTALHTIDWKSSNLPLAPWFLPPMHPTQENLGLTPKTHRPLISVCAVAPTDFQEDWFCTHWFLENLILDPKFLYKSAIFFSFSSKHEFCAHSFEILMRTLEHNERVGFL